MPFKNIIEICVAIDIAILGIAYPIIIDKISGIGERYSSIHIPTLFHQEFPQSPVPVPWPRISFFQLSLFLTLISFFFLIVPSQPLFGWDNWFINNSADILVLVLTSVLTVFFFLWLNKVVLYNGSSMNLLKYFVKKFDGFKHDSEVKGYHLKSINELTVYAVARQDEHLQKTLLEFYHKVFSDVRRKHDRNTPVVYPADLYEIVYRLVLEIINSSNLKLKAIEHRAVSGTWLLGDDMEQIKISEATYSWLWRILYTISDEDKLIRMYWGTASQYCEMRLRSVAPRYEQGRGIVNNNAIAERFLGRKRFIEFNLALGGMLVYREQYKTVKYILEYSQSVPPTYPLLPDSMAAIFEWFDFFSDEFSMIGTPIDIKYPFPDLDNLGNRRQVNHWICMYIALLFIRQYTLREYLVYQNFTAQPALPRQVLELLRWRDNVNYFKKCVKDVFGDDDLMGTLDDEIYEKEDAIKGFVEVLRENIEEAIGQRKRDALISDEKRQLFYNTSIRIIKEAFSRYKDVVLEDAGSESRKAAQQVIRGESMIIDKSAFTEGDIPNLNYDEVLAEQIAQQNIHHLLPASFSLARTRRYVISPGSLVAAIKRLISSSPKAVIVTFNLDYRLLDVLDDAGFRDKVKSFSWERMWASKIVFVLHPNDLPVLSFEELPDDKVQEQGLTRIDQELNIYGSVTQMEAQAADGEEDAKPNPKVKATLDFMAVLTWSGNRDVAQLIIDTELNDEGMLSELNQIQPLRKKKRKKD